MEKRSYSPLDRALLDDGRIAMQGSTRISPRLFDVSLDRATSSDKRLATGKAVSAGGKEPQEILSRPSRY
jgi:hypothetical protein